MLHFDSLAEDDFRRSLEPELIAASFRLNRIAQKLGSDDSEQMDTIKAAEALMRAAKAVRRYLIVPGILD